MKTNRVYILLALLVIFIWGSTFISTKILLDDLTPIQIMLARYLIAYLGLLLIYPRFHRPEGAKAELKYLLAALTGSTFYFLAENTALTFTQASNVSLLISAAPILTSVTAHLCTRDEKMNRRQVYGFLSAMAGIFLVVCNGKFVLKLSPAGDLLALTAALLWAVYCILLRGFDSPHKPVYITRKVFFYSILTMAPLLLLDKRQPASGAFSQPWVWFHLVFLGLVASSVCYVLWYQVVAHLGAVRANNFVYLNPLVTMVFSVIFLHERITLLMLAGGVLILLGVMIAEGTLGRREAIAQQERKLSV